MIGGVSGVSSMWQLSSGVRSYSLPKPQIVLMRLDTPDGTGSTCTTKYSTRPVPGYRFPSACV